MLGKEFTLHEIARIMFRIGTMKALGLDGFQAAFYQSQWSVVGAFLVLKLIQGIYDDPSKVVVVNGTLISLIPKTNIVQHIKFFRPISLCFVTYKVVTKIFVE